MKTFHSNPSPESFLYDAILAHNFDEARKLIQNGAVIPEILYKQVTGHDNPTILKFLLESEPQKETFALQLSVRKGALDCLNYLLEEKKLSLTNEVLSIQPLKNIEAVTNYLNSYSQSLLPSAYPNSPSYTG